MDVASTTTASTHVAHLATVDTNTAAVLNGCDDDEGVGRVSAPPVEFNLSTTNGVGDSADGKRARAAFAASRSLQGSVRSLSKAVQQKLTGWREEGDFTLGCMKLWESRTRFLVMVLVLLCLASIWSNILSFNFAIICISNAGGHDSAGGGEETTTPLLVEKLLMANSTTEVAPHAENTTQLNTTSEGEREAKGVDIVFSPKELLYLTSALAAAALISNFAVVSLVNQFGVRTVFSFLGMLSAITTLLMPTAIQLGFHTTLAARIVQGVAFAANFPVIGAFTSKWTYYKQNGLFVSVLVANVQFAPAITMPVSGALCTSSFGWPSVFYVHGAYCAFLFVLFALFYRNSPSKHPFVGEVEMRKIAVGKSELGKELLKKIPYAEILKTASVWAVWIAAIGNFTCVNMMFLYSPNYLNGVLHFPIKHTGFSASLAPLAQFTIKLLAGFTSDKVRFLSETNKLRLYNSVAFMGSALFLTILAFFPTTYPNICLMLLGVSAGLLGFTTGGFFKAGPLVSKHYSHFVTGNVSLGLTLTMLFVPGMVLGLAPNNTAAEWRWVFLCTAGVMVLSNFLFVIMVSAKPAPWTTDEFSRSASRSRVGVLSQPPGAAINLATITPNTTA